MADSTGRTVLVTGSSRGIGRAVALELARAGWQVAVHGRSAEHAAEVAGTLAADGRHAGTFLADLAAPAGAERLAADATAALSRLDAVALVAGADVLTGEPAKWTYERKLDELLQVDVRSTMQLTRSLGRWMADRDGGGIVTIGWDQAATGMEGDSGELFAAAKGAVMAFSRSAAKSLAPKVRVNPHRLGVGGERGLAAAGGSREHARPLGRAGGHCGGGGLALVAAGGVRDRAGDQRQRRLAAGLTRRPGRLPVGAASAACIARHGHAERPSRRSRTTRHRAAIRPQISDFSGVFVWGGRSGGGSGTCFATASQPGIGRRGRP
jgi:3-oxoacyl-[acyl-carrier protein] reductase